MMSRTAGSAPTMRLFLIGFTSPTCNGFHSNMRNIPLGLLLITSCALSGCSSWLRPLDQPPKQTTLAADRIELPTTFIKGCPYVELTINGKGPFLFLVDTGAEMMVVTRKVAHEAGISGFLKLTAHINGAGGQFENLPIVTVEHVEAAGFSLKGVVAVVVSSEFASQLEVADKRFGGAIGINTLKEVLLEIDYPQRRVSVARLESGSLPTESGSHYTGPGPQVTIATPSAKYASTTTMVDTGDSTSYFAFADIASYPVRFGLMKVDGYFLALGGYSRPVFGQLAGDIHLGSVTWHDPGICEAPVNRIGSHALAPWKLVIDQNRKMLWLVGDERIATPSWEGPLDPDGRPAVFGFAATVDGDEFVVKEIDPGSRAERAGLKIGDRYRVENADAITSGRSPGKDSYRTQLHVIRDSRKVEITMSLSDPLPETSKSTGAVH